MYSERLCFVLNMSIKQISNPSYYSILTMKKKTEIDFLWKQGDFRISKTLNWMGNSFTKIFYKHVTQKRLIKFMENYDIW